MKIKPFTTSNGTHFTFLQVEEICERIDNNEDWQTIINDDIWNKVNCDDENAWEIYNFCEDLVTEHYLKINNPVYENV